MLSQTIIIIIFFSHTDDEFSRSQCSDEDFLFRDLLMTKPIVTANATARMTNEVMAASTIADTLVIRTSCSEDEPGAIPVSVDIDK